MPIPAAVDVRNYLRGYCVDLEDTFPVTGTTTTGEVSITGIDTRKIETGMRISGSGIPDGSIIMSVETVGISGSITISLPATETAETALTITFFSETTDKWITNRRDRFVIPWIERATGLSIQEEREIEEYYSGNGTSLLILNKRPVNEITNLTYVNIPAETQTGNLLLSVELVPEEGIIKSRANFNEGNFDPIFPHGRYNIKIRYKYGYSETPDDLCEAITCILAKKLLIHIGARTGGGSITRPGYSRDFGERGKYTDVLTDLDQTAYALIKNYTSSVVGA